MKPIDLSTPDVRATLEGRKTQFRRVLEPQPPESAGKIVMLGVDELIPGFETKTHMIIAGNDWGVEAPYQPGDILWVRETWARLNDDYHPDDKGSIYVYKADHITGNDGPDLIKWKPSIFMPRAAARIFLRVTDVRVERLQEILCGDMKREGCIPPTVTGGQYQQWQRDYWIPLWDAINAKRGYGWETNPWVWVIEFERANI